MMHTATLHKTAAWRRLLPELTLVLVTIIWGVTFLIVHTALTLGGPLFLVGCRFAIAAVAVTAVAWRVLGGLTRASSPPAWRSG